MRGPPTSFGSGSLSRMSTVNHAAVIVLVLALTDNVAEYASFISEGGPVALCGGSSVSLKTQSLDLHGNVCPSAGATFDTSGIRCAAQPLPGVDQP
jgi:hypothetical protein